MFWLCNFLHQNIAVKFARKMLMKLTPGGLAEKNKLELSRFYSKQQNNSIAFVINI